MASSGNFATLLGSLLYQVGTNTTYSLGNTKYQSSTAGAYSQQASTLAPSSGKWYAEMYVNTVGNLHFLCLVGDVGVSDTTNNSAYPNRSTNGGMGYAHSGLVRFNGSDTSSGYSTYTNGDIIQIAFDIDNTKVWFGKNNTWQNSGDPANGNNASYTTWTTTYGTVPKHWHVGSNIANTGAATFNFGQDSTFGGVISAGGNADGNGFGDFKYAPPSGFLALCTGNISVSDNIDPAQTSSNYPAKQFGAYTYTGNSGTAVTVSTDFQADLIWIKSRDSADNHYLQDSSRGFGNSKSLSSNATGSEGYQGGAPSTSGAQNVGTSSFQAYGADWSKGTDDMIAWCFKCNGGTTTSDSSADITVTRQSNTEGGFAILTYTGNGSDNQTIAHGLGVKPSFIIIKNRNTSNGWSVWTQYLGDNSKWIQLDVDSAQQSDSNQFYNSGMTTSTIGVRSGASVNGNGNSLVAYVWADVAGMQVFSSYIGNGSTDGTMVITGFRVRLLVIKRASSSGGWRVYDSERHTINPNDAIVRWNESGAEDTANQAVDFLSNGFKLRSSNSEVNQDGGNFIFMAWGDVPAKYSNTF